MSDGLVQVTPHKMQHTVTIFLDLQGRDNAVADIIISLLEASTEGVEPDSFEPVSLEI